MKRITFIVILLMQTMFVYSQLPGDVYDFMFNWVQKNTPEGGTFTAGVLKSTYELTQPEKDSSAAYVLWYYDNRITLLDEATRSYNCHGYAWYVSEVGDNVWISTPNDDKFWDDDGGYIQTLWHEKAKISFPTTADHSAIACSHQDTMISKWGQYPLFKHHVNDCGYTPKTPLVYYKLNDPVISGSSSVLCNNVQRTFSESAFTDIDLDYDWNVSSYYLDEVSGDGTSSYTVEGTSNIGIGTIYLTVTTPSGATASAQKSIGVNRPHYEDLELALLTTGGSPAPYMCPDTHYHIFLNNSGGCSLSNYTWSIPSGWTKNYTWNNMISVYTNSSPGGMVEVYADACNGINSKVIIDYFGSGYCGGYYSMSFSPNPTTGETTLTINSTSKEKVLDENAIWEYEVYNAGQRLKTKQTKLRGNSTTIQTQSWKEGVYVVRVKFSPDGKTEEILTGKLVVKK